MARRKSARSMIFLVSVGVHVVLGLAIALIPKDKLRQVVGIALAESPKEKKAEPPPPKRDEAPKPRAPRAAPGPRTAAPAPAEVAAQQASGFTDLGISLDSNAVGGIAVPVAAKAPPPPPPPPVQAAKPKVLAARLSNSDCTEPLIKARPERVVQAQYTQAAQSARVEGRVRLELEIDEQGEVKNARVIHGLGYGLDEAALAAARKMRFRPATRCGKPVSAPFILSMRFGLA